MRLSYLLALLATLATTSIAGTRPSAAAVIYPWCLEYGGRMGGAENCGFVSFAQCQATRQGNGGFCKPKPMVLAVSSFAEGRSANPDPSLI